MRNRIRRFLWRGLLVVGFLAGTALVLCLPTGAGRGLWYPFVVRVVGARSHEEVVRALAQRLRPGLEASFREKGIAYPPTAVTLVGLKAERRLEVWARVRESHVLVGDYAILAASGGPGPKLREGDLQVPEGVYRLTGFNPASSYHLSVRVDYPNAHDRALARSEHRTNLGGDIYIHGKSVSIGCLAIGDAGIEELYLLLADVGLRNARIVLSPSGDPRAPAGAAPWLVALYQRLERELRGVRTPEPRPEGSRGLAPARQ